MGKESTRVRGAPQVEVSIDQCSTRDRAVAVIYRRSRNLYGSHTSRAAMNRPPTVPEPFPPSGVEDVETGWRLRATAVGVHIPEALEYPDVLPSDASLRSVIEEYLFTGSGL